VFVAERLQVSTQRGAVAGAKVTISLSLRSIVRIMALILFECKIWLILGTIGPCGNL
jgi:hypothetical protein